jgi:N-acetylglucosaminyldiphosphoundecaprenol N-acetyl-beta-D-mannosaminyltransferase
MHGVTEAQDDIAFKRLLNDADLVVPDGMPLVWLGRRGGHDLARRVYGPELMETFCRDTGSRYRHLLYGGAPGVADRLAGILKERYATQVVGVECPPFRPLTEGEKADIARKVAEADPDVVWVGLSTPKQEAWMSEFRDRVQVPVFVGVGAAFDFIAGVKSSAPSWMQENGLEWLYRLLKEPRRLWRRYLIGGMKFVTALVRERLGRDYSLDGSRGRANRSP